MVGHETSGYVVGYIRRESDSIALVVYIMVSFTLKYH